MFFLLTTASFGAVDKSKTPDSGKPDAQIKAPSASITVKAQPLNHRFVYVYNFLDLRSDQFGVKVLDQIEEQLKNRLLSSSVQVKVMRSKASPYSSREVPGEYWGANYKAASTTNMIPVGEIVNSNASDEASVLAEYRLIVFPSEFSIEGFWNYYNIKWVVMEIPSGKTVWSFNYSGRHMTVFKTDENAVGRGKKIVDAAMADLIVSGLI
jgi:hypothetical protein